MTDALIVGSGPAGLMAAEMLVEAGHSVMIAEAKPSLGRKFLMAGKSGLNLTKDEVLGNFLGAYGTATDWLKPYLTEFDNICVQEWARGLDQTVFTGSSGRVFPEVMKASPPLRNWLKRLSNKGATFHTRWCWAGWNGDSLVFETPEGEVLLSPPATVFALGGASWARLGSDGKWLGVFQDKGIATLPFQPSNMAITVDWSGHMTRHFGTPVKNCVLTCGSKTRKGEFVISKDGLEGSAIYGFSPEFRAGKTLTLDLLPDFGELQIAERLARAGAKTTLSNAMRKALKIGPEKIALLQEFGSRPLARSKLPKQLKSLVVPYSGTAQLNHAISVAGGVARNALNDKLMLTNLPGVFCAGEMLDWEAPTGGYLLSACLATGRAAGEGAVNYLRQADRTASARA